VGVGKHRRQYLPDGRVSHYDLLKWRAHAIKFARFRNEQLRGAIAFAMVGPARTTAYERNREMLDAMLGACSFWHRWTVLLKIALTRSLWSAARAMRRMRFRRAVAAGASA